MKKLSPLISLLLALLLLPTSLLTAAADESDGSAAETAAVTVESDLPAVSCSSYAVLAAETGQILIEKNGSARAYPASTTKIMTMGLVLESGISMTKTLTASETALAEIYDDSTQLYLAVGEEMSVLNLLYGTEVRSANDGANVLAEGVAGSLSAFADLMNAKADELGLTGTHFVNAHGLPDRNHYTTAVDLAKITCWALSVPGFREIFGTYTYTIPATNVVDSERPMTTTCEILNPTKTGYYEYATGCKLGWTEASRYTLSTVAVKDGMELVCVVMGDATDYDLFQDTAALLNYCFDNFRAVTYLPELESLTVPMLDRDANRAGAISLKNEPLTLFLHKDCSVSDIETVSGLPESYGVTEDIRPTVSLRLSEGSGAQCKNLGSFVLAYDRLEQAEYEAIQAASLDLTEKNRTDLRETVRRLVWVIVPTGTALIALLVSLFLQLFRKKSDGPEYSKHRRSRRYY